MNCRSDSGPPWFPAPAAWRSLGVAFAVVVGLSISIESSADEPIPEASGDTASEIETAEATARCTYSTYAWSVEKRRAVNHEDVEKPYDQVTDDERDPNDARCTVCREDQREIRLADVGFPGAGSVVVCRVYKDELEAALRAVAAAGDFDIEQIKGYRVGRTRGKVVDGLRTKMSNHSFGTALDVNRDANGLYGKCSVDEVTVETLKQCKLRMGGKWNPKRRPRTTITTETMLYKELTKFWKWGGQIDGKIRDLMHFSLTGY